jgi:hypothetical protein
MFGSVARHSCGSDRTNATEPDRWVTSDRACWFTTYPVRLIAWLTARSAAGDTECPPFSTRDTVPRDTPAAAATSSIVGLFRPTVPAPCLRGQATWPH